MKRVKIMLMSIAVLAVAGGALAFKAKGPFKACTIPATIINGQIFCNPLGQQICPVVTYTTFGIILVCTWTPEAGRTECPTELCTVPTLIDINQ